MPGGGPEDTPQRRHADLRQSVSPGPAGSTTRTIRSPAAAAAKEKLGNFIPLTGDTLQASLKMHCEVSGAAYAIYWTKVGNGLVIAGDFVTAAWKASLTAQGKTISFAEAVSAFKLDAAGLGPFAVCYRTGQNVFLLDAAKSELRHAGVAAEYGVTSICLTVFDFWVRGGCSNPSRAAV